MRSHWNQLKLKILAWLLRVHRNYSTISSAGPDDGGTYDTYWIRLIKYKNRSVTEEDALRVQELGILDTSPEEEYTLNLILSDDGQLKGEEMIQRGEEKKPARFITPQMLDSHSLEIRHFYKDHEFVYQGVLIPALRRKLECNERLYRFHKYRIWRNSRHFTVVDDYIRILEALVKSAQYTRSSVSSFEVCGQLYGNRLRLINAEKFTEAMDKCAVALDYLASVGDLTKDGEGFKPNAKTLHAIAERRKARLSEERELKVQKYQFLLTVILALSSLTIAVIEFFRLYYLQI